MMAWSILASMILEEYRIGIRYLDLIDYCTHFLFTYQAPSLMETEFISKLIRIKLAITRNHSSHQLGSNLKIHYSNRIVKHLLKRMKNIIGYLKDLKMQENKNWKLFHRIIVK